MITLFRRCSSHIRCLFDDPLFTTMMRWYICYDGHVRVLFLMHFVFSEHDDVTDVVWSTSGVDCDVPLLRWWWCHIYTMVRGTWPVMMCPHVPCTTWWYVLRMMALFPEDDVDAYRRCATMTLTMMMSHDALTPACLFLPDIPLMMSAIFRLFIVGPYLSTRRPFHDDDVFVDEHLVFPAFTHLLATLTVLRCSYVACCVNDISPDVMLPLHALLMCYSVSMIFDHLHLHIPWWWSPLPCVTTSSLLMFTMMLFPVPHDERAFSHDGYGDRVDYSAPHDDDMQHDETSLPIVLWWPVIPRVTSSRSTVLRHHCWHHAGDVCFEWWLTDVHVLMFTRVFWWWSILMIRLFCLSVVIFTIFCTVIFSTRFDNVIFLCSYLPSSRWRWVPVDSLAGIVMILIWWYFDDIPYTSTPMTLFFDDRNVTIFTIMNILFSPLFMMIMMMMFFVMIISCCHCRVVVPYWRRLHTV